MVTSATVVIDISAARLVKLPINMTCFLWILAVTSPDATRSPSVSIVV